MVQAGFKVRYLLFLPFSLIEGLDQREDSVFNSSYSPGIGTGMHVTR